MKKLIMNKFLSLSTIFFVSLSSWSQCEDGRYRDLIFLESQVESDIQYGNNIDYINTSTDLYLDVYSPAGDSETFRPLVIFAHGGSFVGGSKTGGDVVPLCQDFARMGYVTSSIQYRLGIPITTQLELPATQAVVRGYHDMKAAIRFFRKSVAEDGNPYGIDPDKIYLAGVSAGGFITLHVAYMDELEEVPEIINFSVNGLTGGLEGDSGNPGYSSEVSGIVNICGALGDTTWIQPNDTPVLSFHGPFDTTVPYGSDVLTLLSLPVLEVDGSSVVHERADEVGLVNCFEIYEDQGHVPHNNSVQHYDTTRAIMSNFLSHLVCPDIDLNCSYTELTDVSVDELEERESQLLIYPNPALTSVNISLPKTSKNVEIRLYDYIGKEVKNILFDSIKNAELDLSNLPNGLYQILVINDKESFTSQLVIQK